MLLKYLTFVPLLWGLILQIPHYQPSPTPTVELNDIHPDVLFNFNQGCSLPCFMNLLPGISTKQDLESVLASQELPEEVTNQLLEDSFSMRDGTEINDFTLFFSDDGFASFDFVFQEILLSRIQITGLEPALWSENDIILNLSVLVEKFAPQEWLINIDGPEPANFVLTLIFDDPSLVAAMQFNFRKPIFDLDTHDSDQPLDFCFEFGDLHRSQVWIFSDGTPEPEMIILPDLRREDISNPNISLFDVVDMSEDELVALLLSSDEKCVQGASLSDLANDGYIF